MSDFLEIVLEKISDKEYDAAIKLCDKKIKSGEDIANAYYMKARAIFFLSQEDEEEENYQQALSLINEAITIDDKNAEYFCLSGRINCALERYKRAEFDYIQAIELNPIAVNYYNRGLLYSDLDKNELAFKDFKKAYELEPDDIDYVESFATALFDFDQYEEALFYYNEALKIKEYAFLYFDRGYACIKLRRYSEAIENLKKAIEFNPEYAAESYVLIAYVYSMMLPEENEQKLAINKDMSYHEEFALYNTDNNISYKNYNIAIDYVKKAIEIDPENKSYYFALATKYWDIDDYANAIDVYNQIEEKWPNDEEVNYFRGRCYFFSNNFIKAIDDFDKTTLVQPENFEVYYYRGLSRKKLEENLIAIGDIAYAAKNGCSKALSYLINRYDEDEVENFLSETEKSQVLIQPPEDIQDDLNE